MSNTFENIQVRGVSFRGPEALDIMQNLPEGAELRIERDKENKYDANAIAVFRHFIQLGFLAKEEAAWIAPEMDDDESVEWCAIFSHTIQAGKTIYGIVNVKPKLPEA